MGLERYYYTEEEASPEGRRAILDLARQALIWYSLQPGVDERLDLVAHADRLVGEARAVGNGKFPEDLLVAAILHDPVDRLLNKESSKHTPLRAMAAARAIAEVITHPSLRNERADYIMSMLADMVATERASGKHRVDMAEAVARGRGRVGSEVVRMMSERYQGDIPPDVWRRLQPMMNFSHMSKFTDRTNIETIPIKGLELADNMRYPSSLRPSAKFQDYSEAMSFYPILEVATFDGAGAIVRNEAHKLGLSGQGLWQGELRGRAETLYARLESIGLQKFTEQIFGVDEEQAVYHPAININENTGNYPMHIGEFAVNKAGSVVVGNCRLKLDGTWAHKMNHDGAEPSDPIGFTVISSDLTSSAKDFVDFLEQRVPEVELRTPLSNSKSKREAVYIQGSRRYVVAIREEMARRRGLYNIPYQIDAQSKKQAKASGYRKYEVAKVYFTVDGGDGIDERIPVELQFVTKAERKRARFGEVAHIIYKYLSQFDELSPTQVKNIVSLGKKELSEVYGRVRHLNAESVGVNERSVKARDELYRQLEYWLDYPVDQS